MNNGPTAELTGRINYIQPQRVQPKRQRRGKIHEWLEAAEEWLWTTVDVLPAIAAITTLFLMIAIAGTPR